ncbi:MAG TPA: hypothetical protein VF278_18750 [Pirellulales bacterium]
MDDNPYREPQAEGAAFGVLSGRHEDVRRVALYQKGIIVCVLLYPCAIVCLPLNLALAVWTILLTHLIGTVLVFLLAIKVDGLGLGILLGLLTLVPVIALPMLLVINGRATRVLRENGYRVGLLGAKM